jgi:hypothetical protein
MANPAFDYLRKHKDVSPDTEALIVKMISKKYPGISTNELITIFEIGVTGQYGKFLHADAQHIFSWIKQYRESQSKGAGYLTTSLLPADIKPTSGSYPTKMEDWCREINKCYHAFLQGVSCDNFMYEIYDRMVLDGKMNIGDLKRFTQKDYPHYESDDLMWKDVNQAKQKAVARFFKVLKEYGKNEVYFIYEKELI